MNFYCAAGDFHADSFLEMFSKREMDLTKGGVKNIMEKQHDIDNYLRFGDENMLPLMVVHEGEKVRIQGISGKDDIRQHLAELGFVVGAELLVISKVAGNFIIQVKGSRVAIDSSMASRIFI